MQKSSFDFLKDLKKNNDREWFAANKDRYEAARADMEILSDEVLALMQKHDEIETPTGKKALFRIYRDVRFSKNKDPYKSNLSGSLKRATASKRGGYYFHVEPGGKSFVGGGFWSPDKDDLARIRQEIDMDATDLKKVFAAKKFKEHFGGIRTMDGAMLKTAPKGYPKDHPEIELLRMKSFVVTETFTDKEVLAPDFAKKINASFKAMRPFFDLMSDILTTDINGESVL